MKRSALISDVENGGLKAPHLESIIKAQRIIYCKKFANFQQSSWKIILSHYLRQVGGRLLLSCNFSVKNCGPLVGLLDIYSFVSAKRTKLLGGDVKPLALSSSSLHINWKGT